MLAQRCRVSQISMGRNVFRRNLPGQSHAAFRATNVSPFHGRPRRTRLTGPPPSDRSQRFCACRNEHNRTRGQGLGRMSTRLKHEQQVIPHTQPRNETSDGEPQCHLHRDPSTNAYQPIHQQQQRRPDRSSGRQKLIIRQHCRHQHCISR